MPKEGASEQGYADRLRLIEGDARELGELISEFPNKVLTTLFFSVVPD